MESKGNKGSLVRVSGSTVFLLAQRPSKYLLLVQDISSLPGHVSAP